MKSKGLYDTLRMHRMIAHVRMYFAHAQVIAHVRMYFAHAQVIAHVQRHLSRDAVHMRIYELQSTLVISNPKGLSEILRDIRTSTYQICRTEEKLIRLTTFNTYMCNWTLEVRDILKILWKRGEIAP